MSKSYLWFLIDKKASVVLDSFIDIEVNARRRAMILARGASQVGEFAEDYVISAYGEVIGIDVLPFSDNIPYNLIFPIVNYKNVSEA